MEVLNLAIEFHSPEGSITKKIVRLDNTTKISEVIRLLLDKFSRSSDSSLYQLSLPPQVNSINNNQSAPIQLTDLNKTLSGYGIKNNDELIFKKRQKKGNPGQAKLSNKSSIFKTLFSMSTIEFKLGEEGKGPNDITQVDNSIEDPTLLFKAIEYLNKNLGDDNEEILQSFQYFGKGDSEYQEFIRQAGQIVERDVDFSTMKNPIKNLCNFLFHSLHLSFSQTSLTTLLKPNTPLSVKSQIFYDVHPKNRVILKHIMIFLAKLTDGDATLLDTVASIVAPFVIGSQTPPIRSTNAPLTPDTMSLLAESVGQHNPLPNNNINNSMGNNNNNNNNINPISLSSGGFGLVRPLSQEEIQLCKKVVIDLIQNIHIYLLFSPQRGITQLEGEKLLFSTENIYCIDKCNFPPPGKPQVGELWVTNYRIIFVNSPNSNNLIPYSTSSTSLSGSSISSGHGNGMSSSTSHSSFAYLNYSGMSSSSLSHSLLNNTLSSSNLSNFSTNNNNSNNSSLNNSLGNPNLSTFENTEIPISMVYRWKSIKPGPLYESYKIYCKDFRCKVIGIPIHSIFRQKFRDLLDQIKNQTYPSFAYSNKEPQLSNTENFSESQLIQEYNRIGINWDSWRVTQVNSTKPFEMCESYPLQVVVPKQVIDHQIVISAFYRKGFRFPILSWSHPTQRSSITRAAPPDESSGNGSATNLFSPNILNNINSGNGTIGPSSTNSTPSQTPRELFNVSTNSFAKDSSSINSNPSTPISSVKPNTSGSSIMSPNGNSNVTSPLSPISPRLQTSISFSSIPEVNQQDIDLLKAILDIKPSNLLTVYDTGSQSNYASTMIGCQVEFLRLQSPVDVKESFNKLIHLHLKHPDRKLWQDYINSWLEPMEKILMAAVNIASNVEQGRSVLIQSQTPDADSQLSSLAQLLLDPYYRTIDGFRVLIEKEWISFGHPFGKRSSHRKPDNDISGLNIHRSNQNPLKLGDSNDGFSPIFTQFIFLVWQIWKEFPSAFQFNECYLISLIDAVYSGRFGNFLLNSVKERLTLDGGYLYSNTKSFWSFVKINIQSYQNLLYKEQSGYLKCNRQFHDTMWNEYFYRYCFKSNISLEGLEDRIKVAMLNSNIPMGESAGKISPLDTLDCTNLKLYYIPNHSKLYQFSGTLRELNLNRNNLNILPLAFGELTQLERLHMEDNYLTSLPSETIRLFSQSLLYLIDLNFSNNLLTDLPSELSLFSDRLKVLKLRKNPFMTIPEVVVESLSCLEELDISECEFSKPVQFTENLKSLSIINLNSTILNSLPKEMGDLTTIQYMYLDSTSLTSLPESFSQLINVHELSLFNNKLEEFPLAITNMVQLRKLNLENNQISLLPNEISRLVNLQIFNLKQNRLEVLPASIGQLAELVELNLTNNLLTQLRPTMGLLENLTTLKLEGNRLKTPPVEILSQGLKNIKDYLKDLIKGSESCFKMKLMIVGQENVGKTTLIKTLKDRKKKISATTQNISTDGISIDNWIFQGQFEELDEGGKTIKKKQDVTLSIWDFAGQEIYYTTHQFFLSDRSVYIIAWNIVLAEEESRVEFWLQSISSRAKDVPIIIVGTHLDDANRNISKTLKKKIRDKYCTRFPNIKAIKLVSCISGKGINSLREIVENIVVQQRNMGESLPRSYMLLENIVKEEVSKREIPTISWNEFIQLGKICTISDENELLRATMFLNQLGSLVYFPKEQGLKQFVILDPQWITNMLSSIITTKHSYAKDGVLYHKNFKQIWRPPLYPQYLHTHLIALLEKFEVSYSLTNASGNTTTNFEDGVSLVPSLLANDRPNSFDGYWKPYNPNVDQFGRIYVLEFIPNGFFSRLMVRILNFARAEAKCYWKSGMILQRDQEQILLEMNNTKKTLSFTVRGSNGVTLSRDITETIQSLLDDSFNLISLVYVPCIHCIQLNSNHPYKFPIEVCENAAVKGIAFLKCQNISMVRTDLLVPDLVMSNFTGEKIPYDQLQMDELVGEGGAALVYRARYKGIEVAVKKLKTITEESSDQPTDINEVTLSRAFNEFRRECWVMSNLEHPNIVQLRGLCLDPLCIVTEYLPIGNLYNFLHKPNVKFSWIFRLKVALDISSGMAFLHSSTPPIIHRDLKSPNIMLASLDESTSTLAKVVDFGLSGLQHTITNKGVENPLWLAPEILSKQREYSTSSDVYAFGVILWELLTCRDYFSEISFMTLIEEKVISGQRPDIPEDCNPLYAQLIRDCWQQDPNLRPKFPQIEETILQIIETMFPDLYLSEPTNHKEKRKSLNNSFSKQHRKHPSASSEVSEFSNELSSDTTTTTTTYTHTINSTNNNHNGDIVSKSISNDHMILRDNSIDNIIDATSTQTNNSNITSPTTASESTTPPFAEEKDKSTFEILDEIQNMQSSSKRKLYVNNNPKRNSMSVQPYYNEFNKELLPNEGTIQCMIQVGNYIWAGTGNGMISIWKSDTGDKIKTIRAHQKRIHCLYLHMNTIWSGSADSTITIWNADSFTLIKTFNGNGPACFTRIGSTIWAGSILNCIDIYDIKKKIKHKTKIPLETGPVECILKRDQEVWVTLGNQIARIDINSLRIVQMIHNAHDKAIHAMIEVDNSIWTCSSDGCIKVWSSSGLEIHKIHAHSSRVFTIILVGDYVWSGSWDCSIKIWSTKDYQCVSENTIKHKDAISSFVYINNNNNENSSNINYATIKDKNGKKKTKEETKNTSNLPNNTPNNNNNNSPITQKRQVWSGSFDSSICIWNLPNSSSFTYLEDLLSDSAIVNSSNHSSQESFSHYNSTTSSSVPNPSILTGNSYTPGSYLSPPFSSTFNDHSFNSPLPSPSNSNSGGTLGRAIARRTVSFVLDKFNKSSK